MSSFMRFSIYATYCTLSLDYKSKLMSANVMDNVLTLPETEAVGWQT